MTKQKEKVPPSKLDNLNTLFKVMEKTVGPGAGRPITQKEIIPVERIPTGSFMADWVLCGGIPTKRIVELFGNESSGKTTLALSTIAQAQAKGKRCAFVDVEHGFDPDWAVKFGINLDELLFVTPDHGEGAIEATRIMAASGLVQLIVVDSVAALVPKSELAGDVGEAHMGKQARLMSQGMRLLAGEASKNECGVIFINQLREKIGVLFGNPETTTGGRALRFYSSIRLETRVIGPVKEGEELVGVKIRLRAVKNKLGPPYRSAEAVLLYEGRFDSDGELLELAIDRKIVEQNHSHFYYKDEHIGQGRAAAIEWLSQAENLAEIKKQLGV